jgi:hypothetical protein
VLGMNTRRSFEYGSQLLEEVHKRFFSAYDSRSPIKPRRRSISLIKAREQPGVPYDVKVSLRIWTVKEGRT